MPGKGDNLATSLGWVVVCVVCMHPVLRRAHYLWRVRAGHACRHSTSQVLPPRTALRTKLNFDAPFETLLTMDYHNRLKM